MALTDNIPILLVLAALLLPFAKIPFPKRWHRWRLRRRAKLWQQQRRKRLHNRQTNQSA